MKTAREDQIIKTAVSIIRQLNIARTNENIIFITKKIQSAYNTGYIDRGLDDKKRKKRNVVDRDDLRKMIFEAQYLSNSIDKSYRG